MIYHFDLTFISPSMARSSAIS